MVNQNKLLIQHLTTLLDLAKLNKNWAEEDSLEGDKQYSNAIKITLAIIIIVGIAGIGMSVFIIQAIRRPLNILKRELDTLSEKGGDLTQKIKVNSKDEINDVANSLNKFIDNIRNIVRSVNRKCR